jgi:putative SOS response-associated peptidase YedK
MCGRYFLTTPGQILAERFETAPAPKMASRYNIAPTQQVAIVRTAVDAETSDGGDREIALVSWGLIPSWAKERAIGNKLINARGETLAEKPSFRDSFKKRRCLVLADGFFEWQKVGGGKQPWLVRTKSGEPFGMAGLWSRWKEKESGETIDSCTIVTTTPNELLAPIHDRMPVILPREARALWLDSEITEADRLAPLIAPFPEGELEAYPVSRRVNSPANDDPACLEPIARADSG